MIRQGAANNRTFFFDAYDGEALFADSEGTNCASFAAVQFEASRILLELAQDNISSVERFRKLTIVARNSADEPGTTMTLTFAQE
jgi:hypothetical protein